jgi:hypothetical protein
MLEMNGPDFYYDTKSDMVVINGDDGEPMVKLSRGIVIGMFTLLPSHPSWGADEKRKKEPKK